MSQTVERLTMPWMDNALSLQRKYVNLVARVWSLPLEAMSRMSYGPIGSPSRSLVRVDGPSKRDEEVVSVGEEFLHVGKRIVEGDTTRVIRSVIETPVEQQVDLVTQTVVVERRRPSDTEHASNVLSNRTVSMTSTTERPVVTKGVRLVEEVIVRRQSTSHVETVRGTVKRDQVAVEHPSREPAPAIIAMRDEHRGNGDARERDNSEQPRESWRDNGQQQQANV